MTPEERRQIEAQLATYVDLAARDLPRELARRGMSGCRTCAAWHDVVHVEDGDGVQHERWGPRPPDGRCGACGRQPRVLIVQLPFWSPAQTPA